MQSSPVHVRPNFSESNVYTLIIRKDRHMDACILSRLWASGIVIEDLAESAPDGEGREKRNERSRTINIIDVTYKRSTRARVKKKTDKT